MILLLCVWCKVAGSHAQAGAAEDRIRLKTRASRGDLEGGSGPAAATAAPGVGPGGAVRAGNSWRDRAAERLGLVRSGDGPRPGAGSVSTGTTMDTAVENGARAGEQAGARPGHAEASPPYSTCNITTTICRW